MCEVNNGEMNHLRGSWKEAPFIIYALIRHLLLSAFGGQVLSQLTLTTVGLQIALFFLSGENGDSTIQFCLSVISLVLLILVFAGFTLLILLYRHSVQTIFNRQLPSNWLPSFCVHWSMLRPVEVLWRCITFRLRVLPDVLVLGEVRCGTTTLCHHMRQSCEGCHTPFCLWKHPELDNKETFFMVGHYLGQTNPSFYRICFPLITTKWFHRYILRKPFFTFDGCAQYLTSPSAPYLIARAYRDAGLPPPILIVCVRDPVQQTISWWNYEQQAMKWGESMGLVDWNTSLRTNEYPPSTIADAVRFSSSPKMKRMYERAEELAPTSNSLPPWALTWPGGQLSGIGRNGRFSTNIQRYERVFHQFFGGEKENNGLLTSFSKLKFVTVVSLEVLSSPRLADGSWPLESLLASIVCQINHRANLVQGRAVRVDSIRVHTHRNAIRNKQDATREEQEALRELFRKDTIELERLCDVKIDYS